MHILVLSSVYPHFSHRLNAAGRVLGALLENFATAGHRVSYALAVTGGAGESPLVGDNEPEAQRQLEGMGVSFAGDFSNRIILPQKQRRMSSVINSFGGFYKKRVLPRFSYKPAETAALLESVKPDVILLFWDTLFEYLIPYFHIPTVAYWASAPYASSYAKNMGGNKKSGIINKLKLFFNGRLYEKLQKDNDSRAAMLCALSNICAVDASRYNQKGINCTYISNTWPDAFTGGVVMPTDVGSLTQEVKITGSIGKLNATGNYYGLSFLAGEVVPLLSKKMRNDNWEIDIFGAKDMPDDLKEKMTHPNIKIRGYVDDLDAEMLSHPIFLLLNNVGPHTGGYTRVIYAFSAGVCLIAHKNLALSMPEVKHGVNALLGETAEEIADLIVTAATDNELLQKIGKNARITYEQEYAPAVVAKKLTELIQKAVTQRSPTVSRYAV